MSRAGATGGRRPWLLLLLLGALWLPAWLPAQQVPETVRIGVLAKRGDHTTLARWGPLAGYLGTRIPGYRFTIVPLGFHDIKAAVAAAEVEFVLANPAIYVELEAAYGAGRIATLVGPGETRGCPCFGGVLFTRADRADLNQLADLRGRRFAAVDETSLGGWQAALRELVAAGVDPAADFAQLLFLGTHDAVVQAVADGTVDAGTVRTDTLERMAAEGRIRSESFKVIAAREFPGFPYRVSTRLYPEWPFASLRETPESLTHAVAVALLQLDPEEPAAQAAHIGGWAVPQNYQPVHELLRELKLGPYRDLGRVRFGDVLRQYGHWLLLVLLMLVVLGAANAWIVRLYRRLRGSEAALREARDTLEQRVHERTTELAQALASLEETHRRVEVARHEWNAAFNTIGDPIFIHDRDGRLLRFNRAYEERSGLPAERLRGLPYWEVFPRGEGPLASCSRAMTGSGLEEEEVELESGEVFISRAFAQPDPAGHLLRVHVMVDVTSERDARAALQQRLEFESLIAELATRFIAVGSRGVEAEVTAALGRLGGFAAAEGVFVAMIDADDRISEAHGWWAAGRDRSPETLAGLPLAMLPWLAGRLRARQPVRIRVPEELPPPAQVERQLLDRHGVRSLLCVPLSRGGNQLGALGLVNPARIEGWAEEDRALLVTAGDVIAGTLRRRDAELRLSESEERFRRLFNSANDAIFLHGVEADGSPGRFLEVNDRALAVLGYSREELLGMGPADIDDPDQAGSVAEVMKTLERTGSALFESRHVARDGSRIPVEISAHRFELGGQALILSLARDISERREAEAALRRSEASLAEAQRIARLGSWEWDPESDRLVVSAETLRLFGLPAEGRVVEMDVLLRSVPAADRARIRRELVAAHNSGRAYRIEHRIRLPDGGQRHVQAHGQPGADGRLIGTVQDISEVRAATAALQASEARLREALVRTIEAVALTVEKRDPYTAGHQQRVAALAVAIGHALGMEAERVEGLRLGALIHDIGKIYVPAEILNRPSSLSPTEMRMVRTHPEVGYEIVRGIDFPWPVAEMIRQHQERHDGSGYPRGLAGAEILPEARIMAVADVVEALCSHRPYRPARGLDAALEELEQYRGTLYAPEAVDACLALFREGRFDPETWSGSPPP